MLRGVDFDVEPREALGIVGPTGAGKTTLMSCMQALLPHNFPQGEMRGSVHVTEEDTRQVRASDLVGRVGMVFEDAEAQFVFPTVEDDIIFGLESLGLAKDQIKARLDDILRRFGLESLVRRNAYELSGGQKQRVALAAILALRPKVLLLDEPTAELDPAGKAELLSIVAELREEHQLSIVMVEQDTEQLVGLVDRLILLDQGKIVRSRPPGEFFSEPRLLLEHGVNPPEVALIFDRAARAGHVYQHPLTVKEAVEALKRITRGAPAV